MCPALRCSYGAFLGNKQNCFMNGTKKGLFHQKTVECFFLLPKHAKSLLTVDKMRRVGGAVGGVRGSLWVFFNE